MDDGVVMSFLLDKEWPRTADVFVVPCRGKGWTVMIEGYQRAREGLKEPYCSFVHAGVVSDWPKGVHSTLNGGVHVVDDIRELYPDAVILRHDWLMGEEKSGLRNKIRGDLLELCARGLKYDLLSIFGFVLVVIPGVIRWVMSRKCPEYYMLYLFCSELVVRVYRGRGVEVCGDVDAERVGPGRLAMDWHFVAVGVAREFVTAFDSIRRLPDWQLGFVGGEPGVGVG